MPPSADYRNAISEYIGNHAKPVDKYSHQPRLYALTIKVGEGQTYDDDVVYAAAWLHDLGVFLGHRPERLEELALWDSVAYACDTAPQLLARLGFPNEKIPAVVEAIRTHQPTAQPTKMEGTILRDADILEQLGAVGILRAVCKVGRDTRFPTFSEVLPVLEKAVKELPEQLRLETSRVLAKAKIQILNDFLRAATEETRIAP